MNVFDRINIHYHSLSSSEMIACDAILNNIEDLINLTISEFAKKHNISYSSIIRFINKINYSGIELFRYDLKNVLIDQNKNNSNEFLSKRLLLPIISQLDTIDHKLLEDKIHKLVQLVNEHDLVISSGLGASGLISDQFSHHMISCGRAISVINDSIKLDWYMKKKISIPALYIIFTVGGSQEIYEKLIKSVKDSSTTSKVVLVTMNPFSTLIPLCDEAIVLPINDSEVLLYSYSQPQFIEPRILMFIFNSLFSKYFVKE